MVKVFVAVMIGEFARATGLSADTIRFYIRRGLLVPETGAKGGSNPYQIFTREHVKVARMIHGHLDNVLTYFDHRITNATSEGLNSKIQTIKKDS